MLLNHTRETSDEQLQEIAREHAPIIGEALGWSRKAAQYYARHAQQERMISGGESVSMFGCYNSESFMYKDAIEMTVEEKTKIREGQQAYL